MYEEMNLKIVIANILNEKRYSHCRLCFKNLTEQYVRFDDAVSLHPESGVFQPLSEILLKLLGDNVSRNFFYFYFSLIFCRKPRIGKENLFSKK